MSTRSTIAVNHADGTVSQIYCHFDGYLDNNGVILLQHYTTQQLAEQLVSGGDMSALEYSPQQCEYHTLRGEAMHIQTFTSITDYKRFGQDEEYNYLWDSDQWMVRCRDTDDQWVPLSDAVCLED